MTPYRLGTALLDGRASVILGTDDGWAPLRQLVPAVDGIDLVGLIEKWDTWRAPVEAAAGRIAGAPAGAADLVWLPPLMPRKVLCVGANYGRHNAEMLGTVETPHPYVFLKPPTTTLVGHGSPVRLPTHAVMIDYEVELAIVIGKRLRGVTGAAALDGIFGYTVFNDISARDGVPGPTFLGIDWVAGKGFDDSGPLGPWVVPAAFVRDPMDLRISLSVNDEARQDSTTADMIYSVQALVEYLAGVLTLEPGDIIATGTPEGTAFGRTPPGWLRAGDRMRAEVEGLGVLQNRIEEAPQL
jgi:2-keto-4-pentenoate hydratase/2-oxohepta-3-ene-1,7-dioic acid hydratase in catechol pathway